MTFIGTGGGYLPGTPPPIYIQYYWIMDFCITTMLKFDIYII